MSFRSQESIKKKRTKLILLTKTFCPTPLTVALKLLGWRGEQQLPFQFLRTGTAGDAWLLVSRLHPVRQPAQAAVAVQRVGSDGPGTAGKGNQSPKRTLRQVKHMVLCLDSGTPPVIVMTCQQMALSSYKLASPATSVHIHETKGGTIRYAS